MPSDAETRKDRSESLLRAIGASVNPYLPLIESADEISVRPASQVARRVLCLVTVLAFASGEVDNDLVLDWTTQPFGEELSPRERAYLKSKGANDRERIHMSWQIEAAIPLVWAMGNAIEIGMNLNQQHAHVVLDTIPALGDDTSDYINRAVLRPTDEILDEADLIYRIHWAARDAQLRSAEESPHGWEYGVIMERHKALNWLIGYEDQDWDDVGTDT